MFEFPLVAVLIIVALIFVSVNLINDKARSKRNGKIEIKFTEMTEGEEANTTKYTDLILEIGYRLTNYKKTLFFTKSLLEYANNNNYSIRFYLLIFNLKYANNTISKESP